MYTVVVLCALEVEYELRSDDAADIVGTIACEQTYSDKCQKIGLYDDDGVHIFELRRTHREWTATVSASLEERHFFRMILPDILRACTIHTFSVIADDVHDIDASLLAGVDSVCLGGVMGPAELAWVLSIPGVCSKHIRYFVSDPAVPRSLYEQYGFSFWSPVDNLLSVTPVGFEGDAAVKQWCYHS